MSILIKGIDMPKDCKGIELVFIPKDGDVVYCSESMSIGADQIVEIPTPHGRIIDESDLTDELTELDDLNLESLAPTILEAEE